MIINRLKDIENETDVDNAGKSQHGFKLKSSTATAGLTIQSLLSHALNCNTYCLMASIVLSAAFNVVNIPLLLKRLKILGLPDDIITLIRIWLNN